jgi:hypothetical protein
MKLITVYAAFETVDNFGRKGNLHGVFTNELDAKETAKSIGWYGGAGTVEQRVGIQDGGEIYLLDATYSRGVTLNVDLVQKAQSRREAALAKLTDEEKRLLGVQTRF